MKAGTWNILLGVLAIGGGLSGKLALLGTNSPTWLAVVGAGLVGMGLYQMSRS